MDHAGHSRLRRQWLGGAAIGSTLAAAALLDSSAGSTLWRRAGQWVGLWPEVPTPAGEVCIVAPPVPYDAQSGRAPLAAREVPPQARCPVCGMFPARHPRWAAMLIFDDAAAQFFDTPSHLFLYLQNMGRYQRGRTPQTVRALWTADHLGSGWLPLDQAVFVHGARVLGPMRTPDLPAFASAEAAEAFRANRGGILLQANELRQRLPDTLRALAPHRH
jgi:nitrous oxide reductase accessory protein NosL